MPTLEELVQAALGAPDERKAAALRVLRGEAVAREGDPPAARTGPLLVGMGAAAKLLGVSRATLWRLLSAGRIPKVELFPGSYRVRREDLEALAAGKLGMSGHVSRRGRWRKESGKEKVGSEKQGEAENHEGSMSRKDPETRRERRELGEKLEGHEGQEGREKGKRRRAAALQNRGQRPRLQEGSDFVAGGCRARVATAQTGK